MFPVMKIGSAATALGNAVAPSTFRTRTPDVFSPLLPLAGAAPEREPTPEEADAFLWLAEQSFNRAPATGRLIGALLGLVGAAWLSAKSGR